MLEKQIEDYWNVDGERVAFTRIVLLKERPPDRYTWSGMRLTQGNQKNFSS